MEKQKLFIGIDLGNKFSQISYFDEAQFEPRSISQKETEEVYLIPTVLAADKENGQWYFGEDARQFVLESNAVLLSDFMELISKGESIVYYEREWMPSEILIKYLRKCLNLVIARLPEKKIQKLVVTAELLDKNMEAIIKEALIQLGLAEDCIEVMSHQQCYVYYALRQKKELWLNDVGLFDFSQKGLFFYRIFINRKTTPVIVGIEKKEFTNQLSYEMLSKDIEADELAYIFDGVTRQALHKKIVSTIYVTGQGFTGEWYKAVLEELCVGRRVFFGQNIYTIGACYGAKEIVGEGKLSDYLFLDEDMVLVDISVKLFSDNRFRPYHLVKAGIRWYEIDNRIEVIPDDETELELEVYDVMTQQKKTFLLRIDPIEGRPKRTTILEIGLKFLEPKTCVIQVKDKGFGSMYPSTNRIWEKEIHL